MNSFTLLVGIYLCARCDAWDKTMSIKVGTLTRKAILHVPDKVPAGKKLPLVLSWHGLSLDAAEMQGLSDFDRVADAEGFVVVYPFGYARAKLYGFTLPGYSHNAGGCCSSADMDGVTIDDVAFARALVATVAANASLAIDRSRVYSTGFSNGGFMSNRLACEASDVFAAIAPVSGILAPLPNPAMQSTVTFACKPPRPVPVLHIHGTMDELVDFNGNDLYQWDAVTNYTSQWNARNKCAKMPVVSFSNASRSGGKTSVSCSSGCGGMQNVTLCVVRGGKHSWPGGRCGGRLGPCTLSFVGTVLDLTSEALVHTSDEVWRFFKDKRMPAWAQRAESLQ
jgi:polyhydroxybutyrate depolymerase